MCRAKIWKTIYQAKKIISGKTLSTPLKHPIKNNAKVTYIKGVADTLAETSTNSSSKNAYNFLTKKTLEKNRN